MIPVFVLASAAAGCTLSHGPRSHDLPVIAAPTGRLVEVQLRGGPTAPPATVSGELLEVRDSAVVLLADTVIVAPFRDIRRVRVQGHMPILSGSEYDDYRRRRPGSYLRHISRFPYGAPPDAMERILRDVGQSAPPALPGRRPAAPTDTVRRMPGVSSTHDAHDATHALDRAVADSGAASADAIRFLAEARGGTERYRDRRVAIADGYRRLGPAFPGMGEHWIHPGLIVNGRLDARTPSVLCYADHAGVPTLVGVAYAVPLRPGDSPPTAPGGDHVWHEHSDAVDDESLLLVHAATHDGDAAEPRLAMFHAWIWLDNPDGTFAQNNWTLPFAQLGLLPPPSATATAAQAASLLTVGESYYMQLLDVLASPDHLERRSFDIAVTAAADRARAWHTALTSRQLAPADMLLLDSIWVDLWDALDVSVRPETRARLAAYAGRPGGGTADDTGKRAH